MLIRGRLALLLFAFCCQAAFSLTPTELQEKLPDASTITSLPSSTVDKQFIDDLKQSAYFNDYQVDCQLFTQKPEGWKNFGGARLYFKQKALVRAVIKSSDYRDGSVVVKQLDGTIRAHGGGLLKSIKMTIQPDSRTIRLPTGYSLTSSDFPTLYDSLKAHLSKGCVASASRSAVDIKLFGTPVQLVVISTGAPPDCKISEVIYIDFKSKLPVAWSTYQDGKPHALVTFEAFTPNKGLSDDLFRF